MKNKAIKIIGILWIILFIADLISSLYLGMEMFNALESNPLIDIIGLTGIVILNLVSPLMIYFAYRYNPKQKLMIFWRYNLINFMVCFLLLRCWIIYNNIKICLNPPTLEVAKAISQSVKTQHYVSNVAPLLIFVVVGFFTYILFKIDHDIVIREE